MKNEDLPLRSLRRTGFPAAALLTIVCSFGAIFSSVGLAQSAARQSAGAGNTGSSNRAGADAHLYFFTSAGCQPCEYVKPAIRRLAAKRYPVTTVDVNQRPDWADHFHVDRTPTVVLVSNQRIAHRYSGPIDQQTLEQWFHSVGFREGNNQPAPTTSVASSNSSSSPVAYRPAEQKITLQDPVSSTKPSESFSSPTLHRGTATPKTPAEARALAATVKLHVEDPAGISYATGTVIHTHGNESLVLTCGHVFRDSNGTGTIKAEYGFDQRQTRTGTGELIYYDAEARDIALVVIHTPGASIAAVPVALKHTTIRSGLDVFAVGCDHGDPPTIRHTRIKQRATYGGAVKYDIYGRPVDGRSGGGLFTEGGKIIGVCNAAVVDIDEGIYTALDTIHWQLGKVNLDHLFDPLAENKIASAAASTSQGSEPIRQPTPRRPAAFPKSQPRRAGPSSLVSLTTPQPPAPAKQYNDAEIATEKEVLIIVRSKGNASPARTITLNNPSGRLLNYLNGMQSSPRQNTRIDVARHREPRQHQGQPATSPNRPSKNGNRPSVFQGSFSTVNNTIAR